MDYLSHSLKRVFKKNWEVAEDIRRQIIDLENRADTLKREIRLKSPRGLFMPVERTDLLELVTQLDKLANYAKDISGRAIGRQLNIPEEIQPVFQQFLTRSLDAAVHVDKVINEMDHLLETGFRGRELNFVNNMILELDVIEDDTDQLQIVLRRAMLAIEQQYNPIDIMFLYKIIEWVGVLADQAQRIGSRIELMLARS